MRPRILVTGADGQLGFCLRRVLAPLGEVTATARAQLDLADTGAIEAFVDALRPAWIVNAGAYTAVDRAEQEPALASAVNADAPGALARAAAACGAGLIHYSTDYVFDGAQSGPYLEDDRHAPRSVYGRTKLAGERAVAASGASFAILRTSWVFAPRGKNFLLTMLRLARERPALRVVADQFGAPTSAPLIAAATAALVARCGAPARLPGEIYHLSCAGRVSWHGFAERIVELGAARGLCPRVPVEPITTADYPTAAQRPHHSVLGNDKLAAAFGLRLPSWEQALELCLEEMLAP